jgi:hypothetical protein
MSEQFQLLMLAFSVPWSDAISQKIVLFLASLPHLKHEAVRRRLACWRCTLAITEHRNISLSSADRSAYNPAARRFFVAAARRLRQGVKRCDGNRLRKNVPFTVALSH